MIYIQSVITFEGMDNGDPSRVIDLASYITDSLHKHIPTIPWLCLYEKVTEAIESLESSEVGPGIRDGDILDLSENFRAVVKER